MTMKEDLIKSITQSKVFINPMKDSGRTSCGMDMVNYNLNQNMMLEFNHVKF